MHRPDSYSGLEEKTSIIATAVDNNTCNLSVASQNHTQGSGFAMNKLQVWKTDISRKLEITESEIDFLEHEMKYDGDSCSFPPASSPLSMQCINNTVEGLKNISSVDIPMRKAGVIQEERISPVNLDTRYDEVECSQDHGSHVPRDSSCTVYVAGDFFLSK